MTIVLPQTDPMSAQSLAVMSQSVGYNRTDVSMNPNANQLEIGANCVEVFLQSDSLFPQLLETLKATQSH